MIVAKKVSRDVAASDRDIVKQQLSAVKALYMDAAATLGDNKSIEDSQNLTKLYMQRRKLYQEVETLLGQPVPAPVLKPAEGDAIALLQSKDIYSWASDSLSQGLHLKGV